MLAKADATAMLAVKDVERAKDFYGKLGFEPRDEMGGEVVTLKGANNDICLYRSEFAGTNKATALTFDVEDIESEVKELKDKGILFEHYDVEGLTPKGDIYEGQSMRTAWFKDPDGNILSLFESS